MWVKILLNVELQRIALNDKACELIAFHVPLPFIHFQVSANQDAHDYAIIHFKWESTSNNLDAVNGCLFVVCTVEYSMIYINFFIFIETALFGILNTRQNLFSWSVFGSSKEKKNRQ